MAFFIGDEILKKILNGQELEGSIKVILFGLSFKENIGDTRNSKVISLYNHLNMYGIDVDIIDPVVSRTEVKKEFDIDLIEFKDIDDADAVVFCVAHEFFKSIDLKDLKKMMKKDRPYLFDIKGLFKKEDVEKHLNCFKNEPAKI